jgi:hypothetical protein
MLPEKHLPPSLNFLVDHAITYTGYRHLAKISWVSLIPGGRGGFCLTCSSPSQSLRNYCMGFEFNDAMNVSSIGSCTYDYYQ